ncbi:hypothetical protein VSAK1_25410 [Vibrio mediterranei AK1]|nr:hypothetical protein VSAK1_25410 [Vibrio mediterranei AK1]
MIELLSLLYFLVSGSALLGYINRRKEIYKTTYQVYGLELYTGFTITYYFYLYFLSEFTSVEGSPKFIIAPAICTLVVVSYYWTFFKKERDKLVDSFPFKLLFALAVVLCNAASIYASSNVIEVLTRTTSTDLQPYVDIARWVYFVLALLLIVQFVLALSFIAFVLLPFIYKEANNVLSSLLFVVISSIYVLNLVSFSILGNYSFDDRLIAEVLHRAFHNNLSVGGREICTGIDANTKLALIGDHQALIAKKTDVGVIFEKVECVQ